MNTAEIIIFIASVITATGVIIGALKKVLNKILNPISKQIEKMDTRQCRMFLIDFLNDVEHDVPKDEVQYRFAHEVYDHYINDLGMNSYVRDKWERIMK